MANNLSPDFELAWRGEFSNEEVNSLHAEGFEHPVLSDDWWAQVNRHSLGWVCLRQGTRLVGFANVAWDGGVHAFLLDVLVTGEFRRRGLATQMVTQAVEQAKIAGCEWLHVDFEAHLSGFYLENCGFKATEAGVIQLG